MALGASAFSSLASDAYGVAQGSLGWIGQSTSSMLGLAGLNAGMKSIDRAAAMTADAFGPTQPSDSSLHSVLSMFRKITDPEEKTRLRVDQTAGIDKRNEVVKALEDLGNKIVNELPKKIIEGMSSGLNNAQGWMAENIWEKVFR